MFCYATWFLFIRLVSWVSVPNFSSPTGPEVAEKFVVVNGVVWWNSVPLEHVTTMSNSNASCLELGWVGLSCVGFKISYLSLFKKFLEQKKMSMGPILGSKRILDQKFFWPKDFFWPENYLGLKKILDPKVFWPKIVLDPIFF